METGNDTVTETTTQSWGSRLGDSLKGVIIGLGIFVAAFPVLFWNEGNSVKTAKALDEGEGACVPVEQIEKVDPANEGQLVHMVGKADTKDVLEDDAFGVKTPAIALKRTVEMFQWIEESHTTEKKNMGGSVTKTTTYTYKTDWRTKVVNSGNFKEAANHQNPSSMEFESAELRAANVTFGAFKLNESQIGRIGSLQAYAFPTDYVCKVERVQRAGSTIYVPNRETRANALNNRDVASMPRIGDLRVKFEVVLPHDISLVAKQKGDTFVSYLAKTKKKVDLLTDGKKEMAEMFEDARDANAMMTWIIRVGGFLMMFIGMGMVFKPLSVLADVLPILGDLVEVGTGLVAGLIAFICSIATIGVAWLFYRPILGGVLLAVAVGGLVLLIQKKKAAKARLSATAAA